ncbi:MAG: zinc ribbon domain-containing protein [Clostridia bacterium]|nr:zinc ribbon domain-containing protein [Clostridia bacterium]
MSDFWTNLGRKVNSVSSSAAKKVDSLTTIAKLNLSLREKENDLEDCFEKIGSLVYDKIKKSYETDEEVAVCIDEAEKLLEDIAKIKADLRRAKKTKSCPGCGKDSSVEAKFCSVCGAKFEEPAEETPSDAVTVTEETKE